MGKHRLKQAPKEAILCCVFLNSKKDLFLYALMFRLPMCLREGARYSGTVVADSCELPCGHWKSNLGPLKVQPVILTIESSLQFPSLILYMCCFGIYLFIYWVVVFKEVLMCYRLVLIYRQ